MRNIEGFERENLLKNVLMNSILTMNDIKGINIAYNVCNNVTVVKVVLDGVYYYGMSACHSKDEFNLYEGIEIAFKRAFKRTEDETKAYIELSELSCFLNFNR